MLKVLRRSWKLSSILRRWSEDEMRNKRTVAVSDREDAGDHQG